MEDNTAAIMDSTELKLSELLKEVNVDYSPQLSKLVDDTVSAIKASIDTIPNDTKVILPPVSIATLASESLRYWSCSMLLNLQVAADIASRFVSDIGADKVEFKFKKPSFIKIGGSYSIQSLARPELNVDLIIRLPKVFI